MDKLIRKTYQASETKAVDDSRSLLIKISTSAPDRSKDVVVPRGAVLDNYLRNPVVALAHKYDGLSIAKTDDLQVTDEGIVAKVTFPEKGVYEMADTVYELYKGGFMNAWSIGFIPLEMEDRDGGGREFKKWELLEYSAVLVPDNPEALTILRNKGFNPDDLMKSEEESGEETSNTTPPEDTQASDEPQTDNNQEAEASAGENSQEESADTESSETPPAEAEASTTQTNTPEPPKEEEPKETRDDESGDKSESVDKEVKEGRVLSEKNRKMVTDCLEQLKNTQAALQALIDASEKEPKNSNEDQLVVIDLAEALKAIDKVAGVALRDLKRKVTGELGTVPEDSRVPIVIGEGGGK